LSTVVVAIIVNSHLSTGSAKDVTVGVVSPKDTGVGSPKDTSAESPKDTVRNTTNETSSKASAQPALIALSIQTSRSQPTAGNGLGISAEIKNISDSTVYIKSQELALVLPPEIAPAGQSAAGGYAMLPTETRGNPDSNYADASIVLSPGDTYKAFWNSTLSGTNQSQIPIPGPLLNVYTMLASEMKFIFFSPGDYKIAVVAKYNTSPDFSAGNYRTLVQDATIPVGAPQFVILFGAAIGGLLAYLILPQARRKLIRVTEETSRNWAQRFTIEVSGLFGSILLSEMTTILLSRVSDSEFLIKVSVSDFWSAIAVGFFANCLGAIILAKTLFPAGPTTMLQANPTPKPETNPVRKIQAISVSRPKAKSVPTPEPKSVPTPEPSSVATPEANSVWKPEPSSVAKPEPNSVSKPEVNFVLTPEVNFVPTPEAKSVLTPEFNSMPQPEGNSLSKPEAKSVPEPEAMLVPRQQTNSVESLQAHTAPKPVVKPVRKLQAKPFKKPRATPHVASVGRDSHGRWSSAKRKNKTVLETIAIKTKTQGTNH